MTTNKCFDFKTRKYSTSELFNEMPSASWFGANFNVSNQNVRLIDFDKKYLIKHIEYHRKIAENILSALEKTIRIIPELNLITTDDSGYYAGFCITFPLKIETYEKIKKWLKIKLAQMI